jgi:hypothetical protein
MLVFMLVDRPDPRYGGDFDADEERERRWEPVSLRLFVSAAGSISCFAISPFVGGFTSWALTVGGVALGAQFVRVSLRDDPPRRNPQLSGGDDRD